MSQTFEAVFEQGKFKPVDDGSLPFAEGQRVKLTVEAKSEAHNDPIELAKRVYEGLSSEEINEIEGIALDRDNFFVDRPAS